MKDTIKGIKKVYLSIVSIVVVIMTIIGLVFGKVIEGTLIAEIGKGVLMTLAIIGIVCGLAYVPVLILAHKRNELYPEYGKKGFREAMKGVFKK